MKFSHLTHKDVPNQYQFITFRAHDSVDIYLKKLQLCDLGNDKKQLALDEYLDCSNNGAYLNGDVLYFLSQFLREMNKAYYELIAFAIMPNHVHILIKPELKLHSLMQRIKGASAKGVNEIIGRKGKFWADDYYDKGIRDEKHFSVVYEYIKNNPLKLSKVSQSSLRFYGIYD